MVISGLTFPKLTVYASVKNTEKTTDEQGVDGLRGDLHLVGLALGRRFHSHSACVGGGSEDPGFDQLRAVIHLSPVAIGYRYRVNERHVSKIVLYYGIYCHKDISPLLGGAGVEVAGFGVLVATMGRPGSPGIPLEGGSVG